MYRLRADGTQPAAYEVKRSREWKRRRSGSGATDGGWIHFDYVPGESDVRRGGAQVTGRICVIGSKLNEDALKELFCLG